MNKNLFFVFPIFFILFACTPTNGILNSSQTTPAAEKGLATVPVFLPESGIVRGRLLLNGKTQSKVVLYLGSVMKDTNGVVLATSLDRTYAPIATTDSEGNFIFSKVAPGEYGLIYGDLPEVYLLLAPKSSKAILVDVIGGKENNLGNLDFSDLPK